MIALAAAGPSARSQDTAAEKASVRATAAPESGALVIEARGVVPKAPPFYSAAVAGIVNLGTGEVTGEFKARLHIVQGRPEVLTLGLAGTGEVVSVSGEGLKDWAVRESDSSGNRRHLDLRVKEGTASDLTLTIRTRVRKPEIPGRLDVLLVTPGDAVGFSSQVTLTPGPAVDLRVVEAAGMIPLDHEMPPHGSLQFHATGDAKLAVQLLRRGSAAADAELVGTQLSGTYQESAGSMNFQLRGEARVQKENARLRVLSGKAALDAATAGEGWHVELAPGDGACDLVFARPGVFAVNLTFSAAVHEKGDWKTLDFAMPAGAVVPVILAGLPAEAAFDPAGQVVPSLTPEGWRGFLPASGNASLGWKRTREAGEGALFFTSHEHTDVLVGAGLLRQTSQIAFRILQGKLSGVRLALEGPGEILGVEGANVLGWKVQQENSRRVLDVRLSRPFENEGALVIRAQTPLGTFPVTAESTRLTPEGAVRHSGFLRVVSDGAVRLEMADVFGMMQLAPDQYRGPAPASNPRQVFVYRFPSANYACRIRASQILPEVAVSEIGIYELGETDRILEADLELDIREAPVREWPITIPADYAVVSVSGSEVADYVVETESRDGLRTLKVQFGSPVDGRRLVHLRLEKNEPAAAGEWTLPPLGFPEAKSVRGHIGVVTASGYRAASATTKDLVEVPVSYFPKQLPRLQQAFRLREPGWTATLAIEAIGRSIQADVFHLYSVKEGIVYGSILLNYFVVGAPASEWRLEVPASAGNIDIVGQNVRRDWRREGNQVIVSLHQPVLGAATVLVTFEQPMSARGGIIKPGEIRPLGVQAERGFIQVVSPLQVKREVRRAAGLLKLEPLELPAEFRLLTTSPALATYQYTARPFEFEMGIEWFTPANTVDQAVDFARLATRVSREGQVLTEARYFVKTRGRKALRLELPSGVKLWEARVDGEIVTAREDAGQMLIPLPAQLNANDPVEVSLRLGQSASRRARPAIAAPKMFAPTVITEWSLQADPNRILVPIGGDIELARPPLTQTGFEWISERAQAGTLLLLGSIALGAVLIRGASNWMKIAGLAISLLAVLVAISFAVDAARDRRVNSAVVAGSATAVPAGESVSVTLANVPVWRAMISVPGAVAIAAGAVLLGAAAFRRLSAGGSGRPPAAVGALLLSAGLLAQRGGAILFFAVLTFAATQFLLVPFVIAMLRASRRRGMPAAPATATLLLAALLAALGSPVDSMGKEASPLEGTKPAESIVQTWRIEKDRLFGEMEVRVRGMAGDSVLLLAPPATLTDFQSDGLRVSKVERDGATFYFAVPLRSGDFTARAKFEMPAASIARGILSPAGPAAVQRVTIELDQPGWEFFSPAAVRVVSGAGLPAGKSGATLVLAATAPPLISVRPKQRDPASEKTEFYAEVSDLYLPGPGVVSGVHRVTIRPVQGRVENLEIDVPPSFTVGDVRNGPIGQWRFDPQSRKLRVSIEPAQTRNFAIDIETQRGTEALPVELALEPLGVAGSAGQVGMMALAFGSDAQPENVRASRLAPLNLEDFDANLVPRNRDNEPVALLTKVYRRGAEAAKLELKVAAVAPEIRITSRQVLSIGDDRVVLAADLTALITRAGVFKMSFAIPENLEVESLTGPALSQWTEAVAGGVRIITMHLNGRTIGSQNFTLTLTGAAPGPQENWTVPRLAFREATRQTGEILVVPERGIRLRETGRENASQLDPRAAGGSQPGTLAFRLLQADWSLALGIEALEPWTTVSALQDVTVREGQTLTRLSLRYRVENAAVKRFRMRLPNLGEDQARTVRATGSAVNELVKVAGEPDVWEVRFQRGIAGETDIEIEFQGQTAGDQGAHSIQTPDFVGVRQTTLFVALRAGGRLEIDAGVLPRGWQRVDWTAVPAALQTRTERSAPAMCFRVAEPEGPLALAIRRHEAADALKLRVAKGTLTSIFSPRGSSLTAAEMQVEIMEMGTLRMRLPKDAQLFNTFVNGESVPVMREGEDYLFHVSPNAGDRRSATVRLVYSVPGKSRGPIALDGPSLSVPLENVSWRIVVPPGYELVRHKGELQLQDQRAAGLFGLAEYRALLSAKQQSDASTATALLEKANTLLQQGQQQEAGEAFDRAAKAGGLDNASNEDARVQLRMLRTQQAVLGLNTRRQRMYLDNRSDAVRNEQLEQAADINPFLKGKINFDPQQVDQLLLGNTAEENAALRGIAGRIVEQQLAAEPAPSAIDVTLPERGTVVTFARSLQVNGSAPLKLTVRIREVHRAGAGFGMLLCAAMAALAVGALTRRGTAL